MSSQPEIRGGEGGFAMVFVVFAIMVIGILGALVLLYTSYALRNAVGVTPASRAQATAESGLDIAHAMLASEQITGTTGPITGTMYGGDGTYSVTVVKNPDIGDGDPYDWLVTSAGTYTTNVEGVERTFYRTLEEVITFAGGRYYSALDYVLFSKEGNIDIDLDGDLSVLGVQGIFIDGSIYAGQDVTLANGASMAAGTNFEIQGDVVTERGDILVRQLNVLWAASDMQLRGNLYSGILTRAGDLGGGVNFETRVGIAGGGSIDLVGDINSHGRLQDYDYGVRLYNEVFIGGSCSTHISGTVRSERDVYGENAVDLIAGWPTNDIDGTVYCGGDVEFRSTLGLAGATLRHDINGSIYAAGDVDLYASGAVLGTMQNRVGGDIQAGGNVDIYHHFFAGCGNPSGYVVGGDIYGQNVTMDSRLAAAGTLSNSVGGNIYANGYVDIDNSSGLAATSRVNITGSIYATGTLNVNVSDGLFASAPFTASGAVAGLSPPGTGLFSLGNMSLAESGSTDITVSGDARDNTADGPSTSGSVSISGATTPALAQLAVPVATDPTPATDYNEVLLPQCDFDYYREEAKSQEVLDGLDHYFDTDVPDLDIPSSDFVSSLYVVFVEGDLGIGTVDVPVQSNAVFVATGDITLQESMTKESGEPSEFQLIAGGKVSFAATSSVAFEQDDRFFIYAADKDYDPVSDPVSVDYEVGWFRGMYGQITARGDIVISTNSPAFAAWQQQYSIHYKNPTVLGEAFRIPFTVKSWKEK